MKLLFSLLPIQTGDRVAVHGIPAGEWNAAGVSGIEVAEWAPDNGASGGRRPCADHAVLAVDRLSEAREIDLLGSVRRGGSVALILPLRGRAAFATPRRARRMLRDCGIEPAQSCWLLGPWREPVILIPTGSAARLRWFFSHLVVPWSRRDVLRAALGRNLPAEWLAPGLMSGLAVIGRCGRDPDDRA